MHNSTITFIILIGIFIGFQSTGLTNMYHMPMKKIIDITDYEQVESQEFDKTLNNLVEFLSFNRRPITHAEKCFLIFLCGEIEGDSEKAQHIISLPFEKLNYNHSQPYRNQPYSFYYKNGEFGNLIPCPVINRRFVRENHVNDHLTRSLGNQVRVSLANPGSIFGDRFYLSCLIFSLIKHLVRLEVSHKENGKHELFKMTPGQFDRIKKFIKSSIDKKIAIRDLAEIAGLSPGYFHEAFKATTGYTPNEYIASCKIEKAKNLLINSRTSIIQVGFCIGIENASYFSKMFKKHTGISPREYRSRFCAAIHEPEDMESTLLMG